MAKPSAATGGGQARSCQGITVPDFSKLDDVFGKPKTVDQGAATAEELRLRYKWGGCRVRPNIQAMVNAGKLEQVWKYPSDGGQRLTKAWRVPRKGGKK